MESSRRTRRLQNLAGTLSLIAFVFILFLAIQAGRGPDRPSAPVAPVASPNAALGAPAVASAVTSPVSSPNALSTPTKVASPIGAAPAPPITVAPAVASPTPSQPITVASATSEPPSPEASPVSAPTALASAGPPGPLLDESFGAPAPGWPDDPQGPASFVEGGYRLTARQPGRFVAVGVPLPGPVRDVLVRATFHKVGGPAGGGYGIILRDQGPGPRDGASQDGRFYVLEVSDRGEAGIWRRDGGSWTDLVPWTPAPAVKTGTGVNELEASAAGASLVLRANATEVARAQDAALAAGRVGVFLGGDGNQALLQHLAIFPG